MNERPHAGRAICECCGAKTVEYRHTLSRGLVRLLITIVENVDHSRIFHPDELTSDYTERSNFQKLRYWGFVRPVSHGRWELLGTTFRFLSGGAMPIHAWTWRGTVVEHAVEAKTACEILRLHEPYWQTDW